MSATQFGFVIVVGLGNIGGYAAQLIARLPGIRKVLLVDRDRYEHKNLLGQDISREDVDEPKVEVMARRLGRINPELEIATFFGPVENLPVGRLRSGNRGNNHGKTVLTSVLLGCVDSRGTRLYLSETAWSLGIVYIDAGVEPDGLLGRLNVYIPGRNEPCMQCGWQQADYDALGQTYACLPEAPAEAPTNAIAPLGAFAASLQATECHKILSARPGRVVTGAELLIDLSWHRHYVTTQRRNPDCRFSHEVWKLGDLPEGPRKLTLAKIFSPAAPDHRGKPSIGLGRQLRVSEIALLVPGHRFTRMLSCPECGRRRGVLGLVRRLRPADRRCADCGTEMEALPGDLSESLSVAALPGAELSRTLDSLGLQSGDVFAIARTENGVTTERYFEIGPEQVRKTKAPREGAPKEEPASQPSVSDRESVPGPSVEAR